MPKLMQYQCSGCGKTETLWNSRDRVTPFMVACTDCDGMMQHVGPDTEPANYIPHKGQRVFIDMPDSLKPPAARLMLGPDASDEEILEAINWSFPQDAPWVIVWPYERKNAL